ncbi:MAG TPA: amidohydrolase family protein, partial [Gemmatimonadaceae bacterium]|nr:amidohydrolase family protein [Gemmatimonadaceae bacterium]
MSADREPVTLAIVNAVVWTGNPAQPRAEALAIAGDRIVDVGTTSAIRARVTGSTRVIDARGGMVAPGFIDTHIHFLTAGMNLASVQLRDA